LTDLWATALQPERQSAHRPAWAWVAAAITIASYLLLMSCVAIAPSYLARPLVSGGTFSIGLLCGILVIAVCISVSTVYTIWRNRQDDR
jgi:uncharacterized membrane protein (DUF485 family)